MNDAAMQRMISKAKKLKKHKEEELKLTEQFYKSLEAYYYHIKEGVDDSEAARRLREAIGKIERLLFPKPEEEGALSWENAYLIQQLMIPLYDDTTLDVELGKRLVEARGMLADPKTEYYQSKYEQADTDGKRALLKSLVVDLQWRAQLKELKRAYSRLTRRNTGVVFVLSVAAFVAAIILFELHSSTDAVVVQTMILAMTSGLMGAAFSMLTGMRNRLQDATFDELKVQRRYAFILSRTIIGLGASLILSFFIQAKLVTGTFFPEFTYQNGQLMPLDPENMALLVVWSFIAGFSEKLVPNIISKAEARVDVAGKGGGGAK